MANTSGVLNGDSRTADKFVVRLPDDMRARITSRARAQHRSMNSFIIRALRTALDSDGQSSVSEGIVGELLEFKPQFAPGMPCRFHEFPDGAGKLLMGLIQTFSFNDKGELRAAVLTPAKERWDLPYESLRPY